MDLSLCLRFAKSRRYLCFINYCSLFCVYLCYFIVLCSYAAFARIKLMMMMMMIALKIHISNECKKYLDDLGGWLIERRGITDIKVTTILRRSTSFEVKGQEIKFCPSVCAVLFSQYTQLRSLYFVSESLSLVSVSST